MGREKEGRNDGQGLKINYKDLFYINILYIM